MRHGADVFAFGVAGVEEEFGQHGEVDAFGGGYAGLGESRHGEGIGGWLGAAFGVSGRRRGGLSAAFEFGLWIGDGDEVDGIIMKAKIELPDEQSRTTL